MAGSAAEAGSDTTQPPRNTHPTPAPTPSGAGKVTNRTGLSAGRRGHTAKRRFQPCLLAVRRVTHCKTIKSAFFFIRGRSVATHLKEVERRVNFHFFKATPPL